MNTYRVSINGWTDPSRARRLESQLRLLPGVTDASAATDPGQVIVRGREGLLPHITRVLSDAGYEPASDPTTRRKPFARWYGQGWLTAPTRAA